MTLLEKLSRYNVILASNSPRRHELLRGLDIRFEVCTTAGLDESYPDNLQGEQIPVYIAEKKADFFEKKLTGNDILITADTVVLINGEAFGKPANREEAVAMLQRLSGQTHKVVTGMCLTTQFSKVTFASATDVKFSDLTTGEIDYYLDLYRPYDKAGAYGVQEWIGYVAVESINGSFYNIMGLPVHRLYQELNKII